MSNPYGVPSTPAKKSRTGLYIALACGCLLLAGIGLAAAGMGLWLFSQGSDDHRPTDGPTSSQQPTDEASADPTTAGTTDEPTGSGTEDPTDQPTGQQGTSFSVHAAAPTESATVETDDGTLTTEKGTFVGVEVTLTNEGGTTLGLANENFLFYDDQGTSYPLRYAKYSTSGPELAPGEEATALLYVDVPEGTVLTSISYADEVGTNGKELSIPLA